MLIKDAMLRDGHCNISLTGSSKQNCSVGLDTGTVVALGGAVLEGRKKASGALGTVLFLKLSTGYMGVFIWLKFIKLYM